MQDKIIELKKISKSFGSVKVLEEIDLTIEKGKIYVLAGENGAGKSTICNILSGALKQSAGSFIYDGKTIEHLDIKLVKEELGIRMVHQELQVLPGMTISENIFIGDELSQFGFVHKKKMNDKTKKLLDQIGLSVNPETLVGELEISGRQMVEFARGLNGNSKLIILDEPTSSLTGSEIAKLFKIMTQLREQGISFLFITHRLEEAFEISDKIIVLKDGKKVAELDTSETNENEIVRLMVGRTYDDYYNRKRTFHGKEILRAENICTRKIENHSAYLPKNISFSLQQGEVLGIAGLVGAGRTELIRTLFGNLKMTEGQIYVDSQEVKIQNSADALKLGMVWITEDRKSQGVILSNTIEFNTGLVILKSFVEKGLINDKKVKHLAEEYIEKLKIKSTGPGQMVSNLSGGNQQKVVLSKWLASNPRIIVLDEPTRGIDVGAKAEIYKLINQLTAQGIAVLLISSELPEVMGMSDRILVMYEGILSGVLERSEFSEEKIMQFAIGRRSGNE